MQTLRLVAVVRSFLLFGAAALCGGAAFAQAPAITSFSPNPIAASMPVTITGTDFVGVTSVRFNGVNAINFVVNSATLITATAPTTLSAGVITVINGSGTGASAPYTVTFVPMITGFTPPSGPNKSMVLVNGFNFSGATITSRTVRVNG